MEFKFVDWYSWFLVVVCLSVIMVIFGVSGLVDWWWVSSLGVVMSSFFMFDLVSVYLCILSVILGLSFFFVSGALNVRSVIMLFVSLLFSVVCYFSNNVLLFWLCYELSILSLLFLLVCESPYSERYVAVWYLLGYVVLTSLPMLLCVLYFAIDFGGLELVYWSYYNSCVVSSSYTIIMLLGVMFITKIPVPPFHVWLPIVHAEASSPVSVCLSGYIMKLGLLGVCRFCYYVTPDYLFSYVFVCLVFCMSVVFFFSACRELDGKRWLAFLSLSHILVVVVCLFSCGYGSFGVGFLYSLGHGISAGLVFIFLWWVYELSGSRNWCVVKFVLGGSLMFRFLLVCSLFTAGSLPPAVQFFSELYVLLDVGVISLFILFVFCVYLFFSSLVPFFLLGMMLSRHFSVCDGGIFYTFGFMLSIFFLVVWWFLLFLL